MSIKDRLTKKTEGLFVPGKTDAATSSLPASLRTGPGQMLMVNSLMKESNKQVAMLEQRLKEYEGVLPVRLIEANMIVASKWANRSNDSFVSADFLALRDEIAQADGNVQPIKVRPLAGSADHFEIIFGYRRHRACLDLGLPVLALVEQVNDKELFKEMDRENRDRLDLSPWEQGRMYQQSLNEGLFASLGELSKEIGIDKGNLSKALRLAELPDVVVDAFPSPLDLQFRWAKLLNDAIQQAPGQVLARAKKLSENKIDKRSSKEVLDILLGVKPHAIFEQPVVVAGKPLAKISVNSDRVNVQFSKGALSQEKVKQLHSLLKEFLQK
ncbi:ParB/RepB/Spo0J family partition protein [Nitrosospira sp. Nsp13]|uniref:ParB/RepB/Spo0J family partition protein n=1 Tax=Nitrosospira sp. Nsp13 TaxID=1855332 RepID=UPI00088C152F|nr:ParB/RepB/Spo0J family partition protein [Nitrosospira sp. Nsp13]SCY53816.1 chromosome partitioning protein, ParB family [Nitrosospira sp. Nsp13]